MPAVDGPPCPICGCRAWNEERVSDGIILTCLNCGHRIKLMI